MKLRLLAALAAGYVLGTRAGREQYEALLERAREIADSDRVRRLRREAADAAPIGGSGATSESSGTGTQVGTSTVGTPPVTAGPGTSGGTDTDAEPGRDVGLSAAADPAAGGGDIDVVLPDLEPSSAAGSDAPLTSALDNDPAKPISPPSDSDPANP